MVGTEFLKGQGLGNQLFCYVAARCIAEDLGYEFGTAGQEQLAVNIHSKKGMYFMDMELGTPIKDVSGYHIYKEEDKRLLSKSCVHDMTYGCYVAGADESLYHISDHTLIYGNLQAERYFGHHKEDIKKWLKVKPEYDSFEFCRENLCIMNLRGGEYVDNRALYLRRKYWLDAMANMRRIKKDMEFMIVTDDVAAAHRVLPGIEACHFGLAKDYVTIKNAKYLILSNSTFAFFPAYTSGTAERIIAPKYWARHNVSDGYWASEQNIYKELMYQDRTGRLYQGDDCLLELKKYKEEHRRNNKREGYSAYEIKRRAGKDKMLYYADKAIGRLRGHRRASCCDRSEQ